MLKKNFSEHLLMRLHRTLSRMDCNSGKREPTKKRKEKKLNLKAGPGLGLGGSRVLGSGVGGPGPGSVVEKSGPNGPLDSSTTIICIFIAQIQTQIFS